MKRTSTFLLTAVAILFPFLTKAQSVVFSSNFDGFGSIIHEKYYSDSSITSGGWITKDELGAQSWNIGNFSGFNPYAEMNGYSGGSNANVDWLISPSFDASQGLYLEFMNAKNFSGPDLELLISTDYDGSSAPSTATWDTLSFNRSGGGFDWENSGVVDLTSYTDPDVYLAFLYTSTNTASAHWEVDNIIISTSPLKWFGSKTNLERDSINAVTAGVQYGTYAAELIHSDTTGGDAHRRLSTKPVNVTTGIDYEIKFWVKGIGDIRTGLFDNDQSDGDYGYTYGSYFNINTSSWQMKTQTITADTTNSNAEFLLSVTLTDPAGGNLDVDSVVVLDNSTSSIAEMEKASARLNLFPVPADDRLAIDIRGKGLKGNVRMMDVQGRVLRTHSLNTKHYQANWDVSDLESGVYFIEFRGEEGDIVQEKVVIK